MNTTELEVNEIREGLNEIHLAEALSSEALDETDPALAQAIKASVAAITDTDVANSLAEVRRMRAKAERLRGVDNLKRRHAGVASVVKNVSFNERAVGTLFQRYYAVIDQGIFTLSRQGERFMGSDAAEKVMDAISNIVVEMEARANTDEAAIKIQMEALSSGEDFFKPEYVKPAAEHEVQIRSPLAVRVLKVVQKDDKVLCDLQKLLWNGEIELDQITDQEGRVRKDVRKLAIFIQKTLRGLKKKYTPSAMAAPADVNAGAATEAA